MKQMRLVLIYLNSVYPNYYFYVISIKIINEVFYLFLY